MLIVTLGLVVGTLAQANPEPNKQPPAPASASAAASSSAAAATSEADAAKADAEARAKAADKRLRAQGYRPIVKNGQTMYCRGEQELGSRFTKQVCMTADQIDRTTQADKDAMNDAQRRQLGGLAK